MRRAVTTINRVALALLVLGALAPARPVSAAGTGRIFVSSERDHSVTVLDGKTLQKVAVVKTGNRARHLRFSADREARSTSRPATRTAWTSSTSPP